MLNARDEASFTQAAAYAMQWTTPDFKSARVRARLTQAELARRVGITQSRLSRFEAGKAELNTEQVLRVIQEIIRAQGEVDALRSQN